jgi:tetratricopeptide (TPR) repeat protein
LVYLAAAARWKQGRDELAEEFAERGYKMDADDDADRADIGDLIGELGRHDWAEREWWFVVETLPVLDSMSARRSLALLRLHDRGEDRQAAELMAEVIDTLEADPKLKRTIMRDANGRYLLNQLLAQKDYFLACQAAAEGNREEQRKHLQSASARDPQDPDVLIAMYRVKDADEAFRKQTVARIQQASQTVKGLIKQQPDNPLWYNHWAWLVSNTEGDYDQAVKHSLRSLELSPDSPSYLDTLGRCYYAAGQLDDAVRVQREAVRRHPHLQVMRDQLEVFESALAERKSKGK